MFAATLLEKAFGLPEKRRQVPFPQSASRYLDRRELRIAAGSLANEYRWNVPVNRRHLAEIGTSRR